MLLENPGIEAENYIRFKPMSIKSLRFNDRYPRPPIIFMHEFERKRE